MNIEQQIKKHRNELSLSQEELAERIYVSRQSISNWETGKNYPDINSLILLSSLFNISLDQLIKGDIEHMKNVIEQESINQFKASGKVFTVLFAFLILTPAPLFFFLDDIGAVIWGVIALITLIYSLKVERLKKENDIQTYKEIVAFSKGETLDVIQKNREIGKRPYQKVLTMIISGISTFIIASLIMYVISLIF